MSEPSPHPTVQAAQKPGNSHLEIALRLVLFMGLLVLIAYACFDLYQIAWGTGSWLGKFSLTWFLLFVGFTVTCSLLVLAIGVSIWNNRVYAPLFALLSGLRNRAKIVCWLLALVLLASPVWLFQYTYLGVVFSRPALRLFIWTIQIVLLAFFLSTDEDVFSWKALLVSMIVSTGIFIIAFNLRWVNNYPFSMSWSEGNRLWDYSMLFGQSRYQFSANQKAFVHLSLGRQLLGGIPFLWPKLSILQARAWLGMLNILPYFLLGLAVFWRPNQGWIPWLVAGIWGFAFLYQGPIHPPLLIVALLVALAWGRPTWLSVLLLVVSTYLAQLARYTWIIAPVLWIASLEILSADNQNRFAVLRLLKRMSLFGLSGLVGGILLPTIIALFQKTLPTYLPGGLAMRQSLLWYRLLPNSTYNLGILLGLLLVTGPALALIVFLLTSRQWQLKIWQEVILASSLMAMLVVGLMASVKIGGGADLHNMDMFLIGLLFTIAPAWRKGILDKFIDQTSSRFASMVILLAVVIPALSPLMKVRPISFPERVSDLVILTDLTAPYANERDLRRIFGSLPPPEEVNRVMSILQSEVDRAKETGEVLFMDQRQLLTFGYIQNIPLVTEYEKKYVMDQAMAGNSAYFEKFYRDLAAHRFSLIVSDPLRTPIKDREYAFGEENNAWIEWVARPVLCYYEPIKTFDEIGLQLLIPKTETVDCSSVLP